MSITALLITIVLFILISFVGFSFFKKHLKEKKEKLLMEERQRQEEERLASDSKKAPKVIISGNVPSKVKRGRSSVVLLVEDSPTILLALRKVLERWEYKVITAKDGREAWAELQKKKPDIIISDIEMPELSGIELVKLMRSDLTLMDVPVILITANAEQFLNVNKVVNVEGILQKPFEDKVLIDQIRYILQE